MIDHQPLRRTVYNIVSKHPARLPATLESVRQHFLPKYAFKVRNALDHLTRNGWIEQVARDSYLATGTQTPTNASRLYNALANQHGVGDRLVHKEIIDTAKALGCNKSQSEAGIQALVDTHHIKRVSRGLYSLQAELPDIPTLNELGALLPPHSLVWESMVEYLPTKPEDVVEVCSTDEITPQMLESAIQDLFNRDCLYEMTTQDEEGRTEFLGYGKSRLYKPSNDELVYYSFDPETTFSPKEVKETCGLNAQDVHQALTKLRVHGLVVREGRGAYRTVLQGVRQNQTPVVSEPVEVVAPSAPVVSEPVDVVDLSAPVPPPVEVVAPPAPPAPPAPRVSSLSLGDFERVARQYRSTLQASEDFYRSIAPQEQEINQLREQAQRLLEQADRVESTIIEKKRKVDNDLEQAKQALTPFTR